MSSARLPGKVLRRMGTQPMLAYLLDRLARAVEIDEVVVATSSESEDDAIARFCMARGVELYRGSLHDVAGRIGAAGAAYDADAIVRISGDSPLLDQSLVDDVVSEYRHTQADLVTNVLPRTFPAGQSVEVFSAEALERALVAMRRDDEREHVTRWFYEHPGECQIRNVRQEEDASHVRLSVDTLADAERVEAILARMEREHWAYGLDDILRLLAETDRG